MVRELSERLKNQHLKNANLRGENLYEILRKIIQA